MSHLRHLGIDPKALHFQQNEARAHTAQNRVTVVQQLFRYVFSCFSNIIWPSQSPCLSVPEFLPTGILEKLCEPETIQELGQASVDEGALTDNDKNTSKHAQSQIDIISLNEHICEYLIINGTICSIYKRFERFLLLFNSNVYDLFKCVSQLGITCTSVHLSSL